MMDLVGFDKVIHVLKLIAVITIVYFCVTIIFPPYNFPRNIPTIPFYVSFLGTYTNMDQEDIYKKYLRNKLDKYGAVKIYFASRWNILVTRPNLLNQVLRDEDTFAKSGNQKKIPYAVLSRYTGDNVISAHGEVWKVYRSLVQKSIQFPNYAYISENCDKLIKLINDSIGEADRKDLLIGDYLQRFALANISRSILGCDFKTLERKPSELHLKLIFVKSQIFKPLYMNFPILDKLPIPSRIKAVKEVDKFREYFSEQVKLSQEMEGTDKETAAFKLYTALKKNNITEKQFTDNAIIILIAGHENPQLLFTSLLYLLGKNPDIQSQLRKELENVDRLEECSTLNSFLFETLRYLPPLGQIINRKTSKDTILGSNIFIPKGTYVGYNNLVTCRDEKFWGKDSDEFKIDRWGDSNEEIMKNYKLYKSNSQFSAFHGGKRACLGEKFALFEARMFIKTIISNYKIRLSDHWEEKFTPAGPICPKFLSVEFTKLK